MDDFSQSFPIRVSTSQVSSCRQEVHNFLEQFMRLGANTGMETWSDELRENCRRVVDSLAAIEIHLHLLHRAAGDLSVGGFSSQGEADEPSRRE